MRSFWKNSLLFLAFASLPVIVFIAHPSQACAEIQQGGGAEKMEDRHPSRPQPANQRSIAPDMELNLDI